MPSQQTDYRLEGGASPGPGQVEQHDNAFRLDHPVGQEPAARSEGRRPGVVVDLPEPEDDAGGGRVDPQDRGDAGDVAKQDGRCVAELLADAMGKDDLVRRLQP